MAALAAPLTCPPIDQLIPCAAGGVAADSSAACSACLPAGTPTTFYADPSLRGRHEHRSKLRSKHGAQPIYLVLLVPPFWGSSGLEGFLSSSPAVSTMCRHCQWQCEATWNLCKDGAFPCNHQGEWDPAQTNWTQVYDLYASKGYFDDPTKPLLMDKSPPNMAKVESLVAFYTERGYDYRFIAMSRHPCTNSRQEYAPYTSTIDRFARAQAASDPAKFFTLSYDDLRTRPDLVAQELLAWLPELGSLSTNVSHIHSSDDDTLDAANDDSSLEAGVAEDDQLSLGRSPRRRGAGRHAPRDREGRDGGQGHDEQMAAEDWSDREEALLPYIQSESCTLKLWAKQYTEASLVPWSACKHCRTGAKSSAASLR